MNEEVLNDLRLILKDRSLLGEFLKIDDIGEMYDFCKNMDIESKSLKYSKEEFSEEIENLINSIPENICGNNEW